MDEVRVGGSYRRVRIGQADRRDREGSRREGEGRGSPENARHQGGVMRSSTLLAISATALLLGACASNEEPARQALASAEASLAEVRVDAAKYAPSELQEAESRLAKAKEDLAKKEYKDVLGGATQLTKETATLKEIVVSKQTQAVAA